LHTFLKNGAVFIADAHYSHSNETLYNVLINLNKTPPSQLFLVGDIFQLLLNFPYLIEYNKKVITLINSISKKNRSLLF
jgi:UDP-2,3-diacylglucosamine hydrolase